MAYKFSNVALFPCLGSNFVCKGSYIYTQYHESPKTISLSYHVRKLIGTIVRCRSVSDCAYCLYPPRIGESRKNPTVDILFYHQASKYIQ